MLCSDDITTLLSEFISGQSGKNSTSQNNCGNNSGNGNGGNSSAFRLAPSQLLVVAGILANALIVESVLVHKDQSIEILLTGSLKRKTDLDKMLDEIGSMPFDDVLQAVLSRGQ